VRPSREVASTTARLTHLPVPCLVALSSHPYPSIPLASSPEISASAIVSHLAFTELVAPPNPASSSSAGSRALGLVAVIVDLSAPGVDGQPGRPASELHQWRIDKVPSELSKAFAELEAASVPTLETAKGLGNEVRFVPVRH
jgi:hypothetical protein